MVKNVVVVVVAIFVVAVVVNCENCYNVVRLDDNFMVIFQPKRCKEHVDDIEDWLVSYEKKLILNFLSDNESSWL